MDKKHQRQVTLITVAIVLLMGIVLFSYGFVTFNADNSNPQEVGIDTATVALTYTDCVDTNQEDCANINANLEPGDSISKTFQVENTGGTETQYSINFKSLLNTFANDELVYTIIDLNTTDVLVDQEPVPYTEIEQTDQNALSERIISADEIHRYKMIIEFKNTENSQIVNGNASFSIKLGLSFYTNEVTIAANSSWYKASVARSTITEINIVNNASNTIKTTADEIWNAGINQSGDIKCYRNGTIITISAEGAAKINLNSDSSYMFSDIDKQDYFTSLVKINGIESINTKDATNMSYMFFKCKNIQALNVANWKTHNVINMANMFSACNALKSLDLKDWNVSKVTNMSYMFGNADADGNNNSLTTIGDVSGWNTDSVQTLKGIFKYLAALEEVNVTNWNVSNVTDLSYMFCGCTSLQELTLNWNTEKVTTMRYMFSSCRLITELDLSNFETAQVTDIYAMLAGLTGLQKITVKSNFDFTNTNIPASVQKIYV